MISSVRSHSVSWIKKHLLFQSLDPELKEGRRERDGISGFVSIRMGGLLPPVHSVLPTGSHRET